MNVIKSATHLMGIRHWRQDLPYCKPRFEVFVYLGQDATRGLYYFQSRTSPKAIISKSFYQLNCNGFYPFVLDWKLINTFAESLTHAPLI